MHDNVMTTVPIVYVLFRMEKSFKQCVIPTTGSVIIYSDFNPDLPPSLSTNQILSTLYVSL